MQYTIRNISKHLDHALRAKADAEGKSLNQATVEALEAGVGLMGGYVKRHDFSDIIGTWVDDPEMEAAFRDQDRVDPEMWK